MVFITGDCHADWRRFSTKIFPEQKEMTREDIVLVCGDFGIWHDCAEERHNLDDLAARPFTLAFVDGNHENFDRLTGGEFPVEDFHGGKADRIRENVWHLRRGHVFEFDGKRFFAFGGARSHDIQDGILDASDFPDAARFHAAIRQWNRQNKMFRVNHLSWWEQEMPSEEEMAFGLQTLEKCSNKVDYIISHCCPQEVASLVGYREPDNLTKYFNTVANTAQFERWYFGHYHENLQIMGKYIMLYELIERIV